MPTPSEILQQLLESGALPRSYNMTDSGGNITRFSDIKAEYDEGACGALPFIVTTYRQLHQNPTNAPYRVVQKGGANSTEGFPKLGIDETRPNTRRRFVGGEVPDESQLLLHLVAEDVNGNQASGSPITVTWQDNSGNEFAVAAPDSDAGPTFNQGDIGGFASISFDDERAFFQYNGTPTGLETLAGKSIYMVMKYSVANVATDDEAHPIQVSGSSFQDNVIADQYQAYIINVDTTVSYFRGVSRTGLTPDMVDDNSPGSDFGLVAVDAGKIVESTDIAEIIIYDTIHTNAQHLNVIKYLYCKYLLPNIEDQGGI